MKDKQLKRVRRQRRIRVRISGSLQRPRLSVKRSLANISVQLIDDENQKTLFTVSTLDDKIKGAKIYGGNIKAAAILGELVAVKAKDKGISKVVFDRRGLPYHGRIKALADAARKAGLEF